MRRTAKQWERVVAEYEASGEAVRSFALRHGIAVSTLAWRVRRHREAARVSWPSAAPVRPGFVEVVSSSDTVHLRIRMGSGTELEFGCLPPAGWVSELLGDLS